MCTPDELRKKFWEEDSIEGNIIKRQYDEIKRVLIEKDFDWIKQKYKEIKHHAITNTEFYKNRNLEDDFPVMTKSLFVENYELCKAKSNFDEPIHISSTSGSTGTPFTVIQNYSKRKRNIADLKVFGELCNYPSHERMIFFRVLSEKLHRTPEQEDKENIYYIDSSNLGKDSLNSMYEAIVEKQPRIIFSYPSTLVEIAKYIDTLDNKVKFTMKSVLTAGEGISEENRKMLERVFGCSVYRRYSDMELGILAQDNGDGGEYHLNWGSYYFECLKMDSDQPTEEGEIGRIVITDLFNYAFPMIRYDTGDLGIMKYYNNELPLLTEICGRSRDFVYTTKGIMISPSKIFVSMWGVKNIKQWQFIQEKVNQYFLYLNCEKTTNVDPIIFKLKNILGDDANIEVIYVNEIPVEASNKRRAVVCNIDKNK